MAIPGLESLVAEAVRGSVKAYVWPMRLAVPLTEEAAASAGLHPRARGALLLRIHAARNLPVTDMATMSTDPYIRAAIEGQSCFVETKHVQRSRKPFFGLHDGLLPVTDISTQSLTLQLFDSNSMAADELVASAHVSLSDALLGEAEAEAAAGPPAVFKAWLPLTRAGAAITDVSGQLAAAGKSLRSLVGRGSGGGSGGGDGPEALVEFLFVPFAPRAPPGAVQGPPAPPFRLPPGWRLPARSPAVLVVRLLRAHELHIPPAFAAHPHPFATLRVGRAALTSTPSRGASPGWLDEVLIFSPVEMGAGGDDCAPGAPGAAQQRPLPRLRLTMSAGKPHAGGVPGVKAVGGLVSGAVSGAASVVSGAASALTLGNVQLGGGGGGGLKLHSRAGGLLGRKPRSLQEEAEEAEAVEMGNDAFCGSIEPLSLHDLKQRCDLAGGPVTLTLPLLEVPTGRVTIIAEVFGFHAAESEEAAVPAMKRESGGSADSVAEAAVDAATAERAEAAAADVMEPSPRGAEGGEKEDGGCRCFCFGA